MGGAGLSNDWCIIIMTISHRGAHNQELNELTVTSKQWFLEAKYPSSRGKGVIHVHARESRDMSRAPLVSPVIFMCERLCLETSCYLIVCPSEFGVTLFKSKRLKTGENEASMKHNKVCPLFLQ